MRPAHESERAAFLDMQGRLPIICKVQPDRVLLLAERAVLSEAGSVDHKEDAFLARVDGRTRYRDADAAALNVPSNELAGQTSPASLTSRSASPVESMPHRCGAQVRSSAGNAHLMPSPDGTDAMRRPGNEVGVPLKRKKPPRLDRDGY